MSILWAGGTGEMTSSKARCDISTARLHAPEDTGSLVLYHVMHLEVLRGDTAA